MRLAYVGAVPPIQGGISQHGGYLVDALREAGHDVHVETWAKQYPDLLYKGGDQRHEGPWPPADATARLRWWNPASWVAAGRRVRDRDLLVVPWITPLQAPAIQTIRWVAGVPTCFVVHNTAPHESQPLVEPLTRWVLGSAERCVVHTEVGARELHDLGLRVAPAIAPMPPSIDVEPRPVPPRPPLRLLFFGFIRPYKGIEHLVDAVAAVRADGHDVELTIAGKPWGDTADQLAARVRAAGITEHVTLRAEYIADEDVGALIGAHHAVVLPYTSATQSGVPPVALAAQRPVLVTDVGGLAAQVSVGEDGLCVPPGDPDALAAGILQLGDDYDRLQLGTTHAHTGWDTMARAVTGEEPR